MWQKVKILRFFFLQCEWTATATSHLTAQRGCCSLFKLTRSPQSWGGEALTTALEKSSDLVFQWNLSRLDNKISVFFISDSPTHALLHADLHFSPKGVWWRGPWQVVQTVVWLNGVNILRICSINAAAAPPPTLRFPSLHPSIHLCIGQVNEVKYSAHEICSLWDNTMIQTSMFDPKKKKSWNEPSYQRSGVSHHDSAKPQPKGQKINLI